MYFTFTRLAGMAGVVMEVSMSMYSGATADNRWGRAHGRRGPGWRPLEIVAMVLGFMVFWPIGLAIIGFKIWQRKTGYQGDLATMAQESWTSAKAGEWSRGPWMRSWGCGGARREGTGGPMGFGGFRMRPTGNTAFDSWRDGELARLEEVRRTLVAAEKEFSDYIDNLRRARDREEFDRFMRERPNANPPAEPGQPGA
jgi:hypothetical protein